MADKKELSREEFLKLQDHYDQLRHERQMKELQYKRESDQLHHERELERGRIRSAEIRKTQQRKIDYEEMKKYGGGK